MPRPLVIAVAVLALLAAFLLGGLADDPGRPPASTEVEASSATPDAGDRAAGRSTTDAEQAATGATVTDAAGDVLDAAGAPAPGEPSAADLRSATLQRGADVLTLEVRLGGGLPPGGESLVWSLELGHAGTPLYSVTVQQVGSRLFAGVFDWTTEQQTPLPTSPTLAAERLWVEVPAAAVPRLLASFRWSLLSQRDGGYEDRAPDGGDQAAFPV